MIVFLNPLTTTATMSPNTPLPPILAQAITRSQQAQTQLLKPKPRLAAAEANCQNQNIPAIAIAPSQGQHLALLCQLLGAQHVLEIGTLGGYSTIWLAESVPGIHVTSIEFSAKHRDIALENTKGMGNVEIRLGAAEEVMGELGREGRVFDFVFVDANWDQQALYFDLAVGLTRKGGWFMWIMWLGICWIFLRKGMRRIGVWWSL